MTAFDLVSSSLGLVGLVLFVLAAVFAIEVIVAAFFNSHKPELSSGATAPCGAEVRFVVLVPAHNEETVIAETVAGILGNLPPSSRLLVVADNCDDDTVNVARLAGAEVVERTDPLRRGKGFALEFGIRALLDDPPDVVVIMDADCRAETGALATLARTAARSQRPVQGLYEMHLPEGLETPSRRMHVAAFAWRVKNHLRPLGMARMGLPCNLMGTGMALPYTMALQAKVGTGEIVEDLLLGLELARDGTPPLFLPQARVSSTFPANEIGLKTQRARWETGHVQTIYRRLPGFVATGLAQRNIALLALCVETAIPPLALFALIMAAFVALSGVISLLLGSVTPLYTGLAAFAVFLFGIVVAWYRAGRDLVAPSDVGQILVYVVGKVALYIRILLGHRLEWVRTRRD